MADEARPASDSAPNQSALIALPSDAHQLCVNESATPSGTKGKTLFVFIWVRILHPFQKSTFYIFFMNVIFFASLQQRFFYMTMSLYLLGYFYFPKLPTRPHFTSLVR